MLLHLYKEEYIATAESQIFLLVYLLTLNLTLVFPLSMNSCSPP